MARKTDGSRTAGRRMMGALAVTASMAVTMAACATNNDPGVPAGSGSQSATTVAPAGAAAPAAAPTTTAAPKATVATATNATFGTIFVDASGKTLYTFDKDTSTASACTGGCASTWPALVLPAGVTAPVAGPGVTNLTAAARPDDATKMQVDWNGKPLYTYAADAAPGDTKGDGVGGIWHVAKAG
jgi:predicted lipoprotein with Yx(FWY)xxD motif